jgi:hypothetical protein
MTPAAGVGLGFLDCLGKRPFDEQSERSGNTAGLPGPVGKRCLYSHASAAGRRQIWYSELSGPLLASDGALYGSRATKSREASAGGLHGKGQPYIYSSLSSRQRVSGNGNRGARFDIRLKHPPVGLRDPGRLSSVFSASKFSRSRYLEASASRRLLIPGHCDHRNEDDMYHV